MKKLGIEQQERAEASRDEALEGPKECGSYVCVYIYICIHIIIVMNIIDIVMIIVIIIIMIMNTSRGN